MRSSDISISLFNFLESLLKDNDTVTNDLALCLMAQIVDEFTKWNETEIVLKESFEENELVKFFIWYKQFICKKLVVSDSISESVFKKVLENLRCILSWDFSKEPSKFSTFTPTSTWLKLLFEEDYFLLFLKLSFSLRQNRQYQECLIVSLEIVSQLASSDVPNEFRENLILSVESFLSEYLKFPDLADEEIFGLSYIISNLNAFSRPIRLISLLKHPHKMVSDICNFLFILSQKRLDSDSVTKEAYINFIEVFYELSTFALYCSDMSCFTSYIKENFNQSSTQVYSSFLWGRITLNEYFDKKAFNDLLYYVGCVGRENLKENLEVNIELIMNESQAFSEIASVSEEISIKTSNNLQWLITLLGFLLVDSMDNGQNELPKEIMVKSQTWADSNPFVKLLRWVEEFVKLEERMLELGERLKEFNGLRDSFIDLIDKLNGAYLLFKEDNFDCISLPIFEVFAVDTQSAINVSLVFLKATLLHMMTWTGERSSVKILEEFLKNREKKKIAEKVPLFQTCLQRYHHLVSCIQQQDN